MGKYEPLSLYLRNSGLSQVRMRFEEIEGVLGFALPASSRKHRAWWSNNPSNNVMTHAWIDAGYRTEDVDLEGRRLVFRRAPPAEQGFAEERAPTAFGQRPATPVGQYGEKGVLKLYGCLKGTVTFVDGVDLTQPADPDWGSVYEGEPTG